MNIKLLDCTLRDGGYNNDWNFGRDNLVSLFERSVSSGLEYIEVGFIDNRVQFDYDKSIMPNTECVGKIWGQLDKKKTKVVAMIDYGTCDISNIQPCKDSYLDGIRVIFKMELMHEALEYCREIKKLGYLVFAQGVSFTTYTDEKLDEITCLLNDLNPYAFSIVDTYGLMDISIITHYYDYLDKHLNNNISIGFHAHNNFQLAFANCMELARKHGNKNRELVLDGSIYGMGKGAGNAPLELLISFMNENFGSNYDIDQILEAIDVNIIEMHRQMNWGYSLKAFIAASNDCHPNYVSYLLNKKTLSVKSINTILRSIENGPKKLLYDKNYVEDLYINFQRNTLKDENEYTQLSKVFNNKDILLIGPGKSITEKREEIEGLISKTNPFVISINFIPDFSVTNFLFFTNSKRYVQQSKTLANKPKELKIIATSNITSSDREFDYKIDYESLIDREDVFVDNSFLMALKILAKCNVRKVYLAGFDGYSLNNESDYFSSKMEYEFSKRMGQEINLSVNKFLSQIRIKLDFVFITPTLYKY